MQKTTKRRTEPPMQARPPQPGARRRPGRLTACPRQARSAWDARIVGGVRHDGSRPGERGFVPAVTGFGQAPPPGRWRWNPRRAVWARFAAWTARRQSRRTAAAPIRFPRHT
jgi:hypothetical protein